MAESEGFPFLLILDYPLQVPSFRKAFRKFVEVFDSHDPGDFVSLGIGHVGVHFGLFEKVEAVAVFQIFSRRKGTKRGERVPFGVLMLRKRIIFVRERDLSRFRVFAELRLDEFVEPLARRALEIGKHPDVDFRFGGSE